MLNGETSFKFKWVLLKSEKVKLVPWRTYPSIVRIKLEVATSKWKLPFWDLSENWAATLVKGQHPPMN